MSPEIALLKSWMESAVVRNRTQMSVLVSAQNTYTISMVLDINNGKKRISEDVPEHSLTHLNGV